MTCIVGFCKDGEMYMGSDSLGSNANGGCNIYDNPKIFYKPSGFLYGCTTSYRMIQLLEHCFKEPENNNSSDFNYMSTNYSFSILDLFEKSRFAKNESNVLIGGNYLLAYKGNLYEIQCDFSIMKCSDNYAAVGSGEQLAQASIYAQLEAYKDMKMDYDPFEVIHVALQAAERYNTYVRKPFHIIRITKDMKIEKKKYGKR